MNKEYEEQIKHLKTLIRLNDEHVINQKNIVEQLKQVAYNYIYFLYVENIKLLLAIRI